jgi:hypothetical protein
MEEDGDVFFGGGSDLEAAAVELDAEVVLAGKGAELSHVRSDCRADNIMDTHNPNKLWLWQLKPDSRESFSQKN